MWLVSVSALHVEHDAYVCGFHIVKLVCIVEQATKPGRRLAIKDGHKLLTHLLNGKYGS